MALEKTIEQFKKDDSKALAKVEKIVEPSCKAVAGGKKILLKLNVNNITQIKELEKDMTAHFLILEEWYNKVDSLKKNKEYAYYQSLKNAAEENNEKFVSAPTEKEAALYVAPERKLRDKILGSKNGAVEAIKTCRNLINNQEVKTQTSPKADDLDTIE
jgi:hypothetical protein